MFRIIVAVAAVVTILALVGVASADGTHLNNDPTFTDNGLTLTGAGTAYGLGNTDLTVNLSAPALITGNATCTNPSGKQKPAGHNPVTTASSATGSTVTPGALITSGHSDFSVTTVAPSTPVNVPGAPSCPNSSWTEEITSITAVRFTGGTLTFLQPALVLTVACTFSTPTVNGPVPAANVSC